MEYLEIKLYQSSAGISGEAQYPRGRFSSGYFGPDSRAVVDHVCQTMNKYPKEEVIIRVKPQLSFRQCDELLEPNILAEIKHLLRIQDYNVR